MTTSQILKGKRAVVFGAGGSIGAAVAKEFAAEGADVFLAGRTKSNVEEVSEANRERWRPCLCGDRGCPG
jgi:NAD(P)-dependent dehydrogenase (short-subunit alcohol dehydrogenase family)